MWALQASPTALHAPQPSAAARWGRAEACRRSASRPEDRTAASGDRHARTAVERSRPARHPARALPEDASDPRRRRVEEMRDVEADPRYRRVDFSSVHAYEARQAFLACIAKGEAAVDLAAAALHVAAEDDALVSHSTVQLPVAAYIKRLERMAAELASHYLPAALQRHREARSQQPVAAGDGGGGGTAAEAAAEAEALLAEIQRYMYSVQRFNVPAYGRSNLPERAVVDHPGTWETASHAYLNEVLVSKKGTPAVLAIILADLVRRLLLLGAIDFTVKADCSDLGRPPKAQVMPGLTRAMVVRPDGTVLNTCSTDALCEILWFLKRAYWPFKWDAATGGFSGAAEVFLEGEADVELQAISRTAKHRLDRGIWTSPGAGDIRRALVACERLVLLCGEHCPWERRDLAVLYMHVGLFREAKAELQRFARAPAPTSLGSGAATDAAFGPAFVLSPTGVQVASGQTLREQEWCDRLMALLSGMEAAEPLCVESARQQQQPQLADDSRLPLTW